MQRYKMHLKNGSTIIFQSEKNLEKIRGNILVNECLLESTTMCGGCPLDKPCSNSNSWGGVDKVVRLVKRNKAPVKIKSYSELMMESRAISNGTHSEFIYNYFTKEVLK